MLDYQEIKFKSESEEKDHAYWAKLSEYEGPLDILLHFVKEEELNIYDIPISKITKDFLDYINYIQTLDIEVAGEFLLMASELMKIKARMLLPQLDDEGELMEEDPRMTLVRRLVEYKRFKDAGAELLGLEKEERERFYRLYFESDERIYEKDFETDKSLKSLTIYNLIKGYKTMVSHLKPEIVHPIEVLDMTPEIQKEFLINLLERIQKIDFEELTKDMKDKIIIVCTFLSILQLALEGYLWIDVEPAKLSVFSIRKILENTIAG
jgi:segregation and condensation protein A